MSKLINDLKLSKNLRSIKIGGDEIPQITQDEKGVRDNNDELSFIPLIYQEQGDLSNNLLILYDISTENFIDWFFINPSNNNNHLHLDEHEFNCFTMSRSSNVQINDDG